MAYFQPSWQCQSTFLDSEGKNYPFNTLNGFRSMVGFSAVVLPSKNTNGIPFVSQLPNLFNNKMNTERLSCSRSWYGQFLSRRTILHTLKEQFCSGVKLSWKIGQAASRSLYRLVRGNNALSRLAWKEWWGPQRSTVNETRWISISRSRLNPFPDSLQNLWPFSSIGVNWNAIGR